MLYTNVCAEELSKIALGTFSFGASVSKNTSFDIMDRYYFLGGNILDTARVYSDNLSEMTVGAWINERGIRDKIYISTKGGHPALSDWSSRLDEKSVVSDLEESLKFLKTDYVDIYYLHRDDETKSVSEIMPILDKFVKSGKVRYIGASNWKIERIEEANQFARENGLAEFTYSQIMWNYAKVNTENLADKTMVVMDDGEYAGYKNSSLTVMAYTSQAQGLFSYIEKYGIDGIPEHMKSMYVNETTINRANKVISISEQTGVSPTAVSLGHLLYNEVNAIPIIGVSSVGRLEESLSALDLPREYYESLRR